MDTRRIMVALDGSAMAEAALPVAESLASRTETTFILVRAADALDAAEKYLETVATALTTRGFEKVETLPMYGPAAAAILEAARTHEPGLIVMATSGRSRVRPLMFASVAEAVVRGTQTPVFLVRAGDPPGRSAYRRGVSSEREREPVTGSWP
jgi:nucleotide-binding universal stress UspA family protein